MVRSGLTLFPSISCIMVNNFRSMAKWLTIKINQEGSCEAGEHVYKNTRRDNTPIPRCSFCTQITLAFPRQS